MHVHCGRYCSASAVCMCIVVGIVVPVLLNVH